MNKVPQIDLISNMKHRQVEVLERLDNGPVILTRNGKPVAVMVSPEDWDAIVDEFNGQRAITHDRINA